MKWGVRATGKPRPNRPLVRQGQTSFDTGGAGVERSPSGFPPVEILSQEDEGTPENRLKFA